VRPTSFGWATLPARISQEEKSGVVLNDDADDRLIAIEIVDASTQVEEVENPASWSTSGDGVASSSI